MKYLRHRAYINLPMLLRVVGLLLIIEAGFMIVPMITGLIYKEGSAIKFLICMGITAGAGSAMVSLKPHYRDMGKRDAILLTGMIWIILSLFGMLPFLLCHTHLSVTDAFFETMSGFTTTGASVLDSLKDVPHSILVWRCVIQWVGGLGIILFTLAVVPMLNYQGGMQLFNAEVTGITHDKLRPRVSYTAKGLWGVYIILTVILIVLLSFSKMDFFDSFCYGLSTMSTGGFSTSDMSLDHYDSNYIKVVMSIFMFIGGVNFALIYNLALKRTTNIWKNDAFRWYVCIILICYALFCINVTIEGLVLEPADLTIDPLFQAISILSSTGVTEPDFADWGALSTLVLIVMMFMGACAGSTSGGAKIDRFIILFRFLKNEFYKMMHPSTVTTVTINQKGTTPAIVNKTLAFLFIYAIVIIVGGMVLCLLGMPLRDGFFCALSAVSNTGLGTATTGISGNFSLVSDVAKWILSFIMLVGRLELFTILLIFTPNFWKK
ncbi:MAG: TrkH family potassium uptake protein [Muribaculaceae bacterium]|nr:TrkH family potassium uptake protein [Muribaculaceae bacterium]